MTNKLHVYLNPDAGDDPKVTIYGTPAGLRYLAERLIKLANDDQQQLTKFEDAQHDHLWATGPGPLLETSLSLVLGRMDHKLDGNTDWYEQQSANARLKKLLRENPE